MEDGTKMASPQKEDGYTAIANEIMDALISCEMSGQDFKIALLIIRKTYGFNKCEDAVSLSQMMAATGMCKVRCSQVVNRLQLMKILTVTENINGKGKKYKFNKDFDSWETVNKNINRIEKTKSTVNEKRNQPLMKSVTTKDNITKDNIQNTKQLFILPDFISKETWEAFKEMRKSLKAPLTVHASNLIVKKLISLQKENHRNKPEDVLNQSTMNSWKGVFELKDGGNGNGNRNVRTYADKFSNPRIIPDETINELERINSEYATNKANYERKKAAAAISKAQRNAEGNDVPDFGN